MHAEFPASTSDNKLKDLILARQIPLGTTESGKAWCLKALHPAEPLVTADGIPDEDSYPVVFQNYAQSVTLNNPTPAVSGNWDADVYFFPHPYIVGSVHTTDSAGAESWSTILNSQISGTTMAEKKAAFLAIAQRYRIAYMGITGYHDAAAISNNGLLASAQYMDCSKEYTWNGYASAQSYSRPVEGWPDAPRTFTQLQSMPNAYFGAAREGVYAPYRLSLTHQVWQNASSTVVHANYPWTTATDGYAAGTLPSTAPATGYPYGLAIGPYTTVSNASDWLLHRRADTGVIHISLKQIAQDASFTFYYRSGWEYQVLPGTTLACFARSSPMYDPEAISAYFKISREMKDAYPACYNDLGKILGTIANIAKDVIGTIFPVSRPIMDIAQRLLAPKSAESTTSALGTAQPVPDLMSAASKEDTQASLAQPRRVQSRAVSLARKAIGNRLRR